MLKIALSFFSLCLLPACLVANELPDAAQKTETLVRLDAVKAQYHAADAQRPALAKDLVMLANFEQDNTIFLGPDSYMKADFDKGNYQEGKFGRGYYFERPRINDLPPEIAHPETDTRGFQSIGNAALSLVETQTQFGKTALEVKITAPDTGVKTASAPIHCERVLPHEKIWTMMESAYIKGPKDARVRIELSLDPTELPAPPKNKPTDAKALAPRIPDKSVPQEITLTGDWQRVACTAESDGRISPERSASLSIRSVSPDEMTLLLDGLQFEPVAYYPQGHVMPTTWTPGLTRVPCNSAGITSPLRECFPVHEGTMAFWTRTPHSSNLTNQGNIVWLSFATGWGPGWTMGTYSCTAGGEGHVAGPVAQNVADGRWHHVAMTWDADKASTYTDGVLAKSFDRKFKDHPIAIETNTFVLGGFTANPTSANSVMDEVAIFNQRLSDDQVKQLATATAPLPLVNAPLIFSQPSRSVYYRNEEHATLDLDVIAENSTSQPVQMDWSVGNLLVGHITLTLAKGFNHLAIPFAATGLASGSYVCRMGATIGAQPAYYEFPITIAPALRPDQYTFSTWGGGGETAEWRAFCKKLGFNAVDTYATNIEQLGKEGFFYGWHYNFGNGVASPANKQKARELTRKLAAQRADFPNWKYTLFNSEVGAGIPDDRERKTWFDAFVLEKLGFPIPDAQGWKFGTSHNPDSCWLPAAEPANLQGVYKDNDNFRWLKWWHNYGMGWWRLNAEAAAEIKVVRPDVTCWTDPLWYPGQIADLDAGGNWSYQIKPELLIGTFEHSYSYAHSAGKDYYVTLGMSYVNGLTGKITMPDGMTRELAPTADDAIQQCWLSVSRIASDGLFYWDLNGWFDGLRDGKKIYCEPGADDKLGAVMKNDLLPLGTMLKHVPNAQRPIGVLLPESTLWVNNGEGKWGWGTYHYGNQWLNWVGSTGLPYDVIADANITPGSLSKYKVIIFPMAQFISEQVDRELQAAGQSGAKIIVDTYCKQKYPGMEQWDLKYKFPLDPVLDRTARGNLAKLIGNITPSLDAFAVGEAGAVFTSERQYHGVKYISVINNLRQTGPYTDWTKHADFLPYGKEQNATVTYVAPPGAAVYEFTQSMPMTVNRASGESEVCTTTDALPPHRGRVLCVYPRPLKTIAIQCEKSIKAGSSGALSLTILDASDKPAQGMQLFDVTVCNPKGQVHDESGMYRATDGIAAVPLRPALNDLKGTWQIRVTEHSSGLKQSKNFKVE